MQFVIAVDTGQLCSNESFMTVSDISVMCCNLCCHKHESNLKKSFLLYLLNMIKILQGTTVRQTVLGGLTTYIIQLQVSYSICAKNHQSQLAVPTQKMNDHRTFGERSCPIDRDRPMIVWRSSGDRSYGYGKRSCVNVLWTFSRRSLTNVPWTFVCERSLLNFNWTFVNVCFMIAIWTFIV